LTVWLDGDGDGIMQADERRATTDGMGQYTFGNSSSGTYRIRLRLPLGWQQTFPAGGAATIVTQSTSAQQVTAPDIGAHSFDVVGPTVTAMAFDIETVGPPALRVDFSEDVAPTLEPHDLQLLNLMTGQTVPASVITVSMDDNAWVARFMFPGYGSSGLLADGNYRAILAAGSVADSAGNPLATDQTADFFVLAADANRDRSVDTIDFNVLAANFGQSGKTFSQGNFDYDAAGNVDTVDFNLLVANFGKALEPASALKIPKVLPFAAPDAGPPLISDGSIRSVAIIDARTADPLI
jgi:hypothetical protein